MLFNELSKERQEKEIQKCRENDSYLDYEWWEFVDEDFKTTLELIGFYRINTQFTGFWSQGDGASFTAKYSNEKRIAPKIKAYAPKDDELYRIAKGIQDIQQKCKYVFECNIYSAGHYSHSHTMQLDFDSYEDEKILKFEDKFLAYARDLANWYYARLEEEYNFLNSHEAIAEHLISNEIDFED